MEPEEGLLLLAHENNVRCSFLGSYLSTKRNFAFMVSLDAGVLSYVVLCLLSLLSSLDEWIGWMPFFFWCLFAARWISLWHRPKWKLLFFRPAGLYVWPRFVCWLVLSSVFKYTWRCWLTLYVWFEFQWKSCVKMAPVCWPVCTVVPICACIYGLWPTGVFVSSCGFVLCGGC